MTVSNVSLRVACILAACAMALLGGCANMSGLDGSTEYACAAPQGVQCDSVSGNYHNALHNNLPSQRQMPENGDTAKTPAARPPTRASDTQPMRLLPIAQPASVDPSAATGTALPLRSQARVLRLWFKPWEDADRDLYDQGYVYVQIDSGRWLIDHAHRRIRDAYAPIRPPRATPGAGSSAQSAHSAPKPAEPSFVGRASDKAPTASKAFAGAAEIPAVDLP